MRQFSVTFYTTIFLGFLIFTGCNSDESCNREPAINITNQQLHEQDIQAIDSFLAENNINAQTDPSGLRFVINNQGDGAQPELCDNVAVTFSGRLLSNGNEFDSAENPIRFRLLDLISAWQIGIPKLREGGSITLYVPSSLGFGDRSAGEIPPNSNLIFDVQLISVVN